MFARHGVYLLARGRKTGLMLAGDDTPRYFTAATDRYRPVSVRLKPIDSMPGEPPPRAPRVSYCVDCVDSSDLDLSHVTEVQIDGKG